MCWLICGMERGRVASLSLGHSPARDIRVCRFLPPVARWGEGGDARAGLTSASLPHSPQFLPYESHPVVTPSEPGAVALARHLTAIGARMYGAFWCSHCAEQKEVLGREAFAAIDYVECWPDGWKKGGDSAPACTAAGLKGYPTWVIRGERVEGDRTLAELAELSGFQGEKAADQLAMAPAGAR